MVTSETWTVFSLWFVFHLIALLFYRMLIHCHGMSSVIDWMHFGGLVSMES